MAISQLSHSTTTDRPLGPRAAMREPLETIQGHAWTQRGLCRIYHARSLRRIAADRLHDRALTLAKRAARERGAHEIVALIELAEHHDADEDAVAVEGDGDVVLVDSHALDISVEVEALCKAGAPGRQRQGRGEGR